MTLRYLPAPEAYVGPDACEACKGAGITGEKHEMPATPVEGLILDEICQECGGCGRSDHTECDPKSHIEWSQEDYQDFEESDFDPSEESCPSCQGRRWYAMQGFTSDHDDQVQSVTLRAPCGCAEALLTVVDVLAGPGSTPSAGYVI